MSASLKLNDTEIFSELNQVVTAKNINVAANDTTTPSMCKAWVNFDGHNVVSTASTAGIKSSFNVSTLLDNAVGVYTINFENALADENYTSVYGGCQDLTLAGVGYYVGTFTQSGTIQLKSSTQLKICMKDQAGAQKDAKDISIAIFR